MGQRDRCLRCREYRRERFRLIFLHRAIADRERLHLRIASTGISWRRRSYRQHFALLTGRAKRHFQRLRGFLERRRRIKQRQQLRLAKYLGCRVQQLQSSSVQLQPAVSAAVLHQPALPVPAALSVLHVLARLDIQRRLLGV